MLAVWNLTTLKTTGQQRVAVLVADIGEVLARHTDARRPGALQTINEVPFLSMGPFLKAAQAIPQENNFHALIDGSNPCPNAIGKA